MPTSTSTSTTTTSSSVARSFGTRTLQLGTRGLDVTILQRDLSALKFKIPASGRFNALTLRELKAFQRRYRLTVDGVAGPTTIGTLKRLLSSKLHITESALAAKEIASGVAVTATSDNQPLPAGDSGLSGGVGLGTTTTGTTTTGTDTTTGTTTTTSSTVQDATLIGGIAVPAQGTPEVIVQMLDAANQIAFDPYIYGGGHGSFTAAGYDCSGSISYVLHAGGLLATPLDSEQFLQYGLAGKGNWITIYTNGPTHAYMEIAGLWFDTAAQTALNGNDRWSPVRIGEPGYGTFKARHPANW
ncbi:MAG TPA: peptidoglycan-binding domain-containing protein [Solirubrobacteraceae bacterium]|nr:peptidoglycan-binding domain-containing protein [Solirubrobacteraceae bacterium]